MKIDEEVREMGHSGDGVRHSRTRFVVHEAGGRKCLQDYFWWLRESRCRRLDYTTLQMKQEISTDGRSGSVEFEEINYDPNLADGD